MIFFEGGHGKVTVGIAIASTSKQFAWSNTNDTVTVTGDNYYHIVMSDQAMSADGVLYSNGTVLSGILPEGSYLERYR